MTILQCRYGKISVPQDDDLIFNALREYGEWSQKELDMLSYFVRPGDTVLDIGAFIGTHTRAFSQMVGPHGIVHAFEPNERAHCELIHNAQLASYRNINTYRTALGNQKQPMFLQQENLHANLGASQLSVHRHDQDVMIDVQILDDIGFSRINFIKADVEGMEYEVVTGGACTICKHMPVIFLEANSLQSAGRIIDLAHGMDYLVYGHVSPAFNLDNFNQSTTNIFGEANECGLLLIPRDRFKRWENTLSCLGYPIIETIDDLSLLLLHKPQYIHDVLNGSAVFEELAEKLVHKRFSEIDKLRAQLVATEVAKTNAEQLAISRFQELSLLAEQLNRTEQAKAYAEQLAFARYDELNKIKNSIGYRLLTTLRIVPGKGISDA